MAPPLIEEVTRPDGTRGMRYNFHAGQKRAWASAKRIVAIISGARSGKTSFGAPWLHREIARCGPGDYLVAAPNYPLLDKGAGPEIEHVLGRILQLGQMKRAPFRFDFSPAGCKALWGVVPERRQRIIFGHADDPDSLESMTVKAAWLDECGQSKFKLGSWEAIQRRLSIDRGRVLLTTTPYSLGWLKQKVQDPWEAAGRNHAEIDLIRFSSLANPVFPREEYDRARRDLPGWRFGMMFRGEFTRPAGLIYDSFDPALHRVPRFAVPEHWPRHLGLDFGGVNTAGVFFAEELNLRHEPTGRLFGYREYHAGSRTAAQHAAKLLEDEPRLPSCVGGSKSEGQWRKEFAAAGLPVREPAITGPDSVEVGINRVWSAFSRGEVFVFEDLAGLLDELASYSRELDDAGEPTEKIEAKESFHALDACRYVLGWLKGGSVEWKASEPHPQNRSEIDRAPEGVFNS